MRSGQSWALFLAIVITSRHRLPAADCNRNGIDDFVDVVAGTGRDCNQNDVPDECDIESVNDGLRAVDRLYQGAPPLALRVRDFDGDGELDIAVAVLGLDGFLYWTKGPAGNYLPRQQLRLPDKAHAMDVGDLDGDADLDVVLAGLSRVMLLENKGRVFDLGPTLLPGAAIRGVAASDLDGDRDIDIAVATESGLTLLLHGDGWDFDVSRELPIGSEPLDVAAVDVDGDLDPDLVTVNFLDNVSVFINEGAGVLSQPRNHAAGSEPRALTPADLDGDGDIDLVVAGRGLSILFNSGGKFTDRVEIPLSVPEARCVAAADLDADGDLDLVAGGLSLVLNRGDGSFAKAKWSGATAFPGFMVATDLDGQGGMELVAADAHELSVRIFAAALIANSPDCDRDAIPDDCELEEGDCNANSVPDGCDLASGTSNDCNSNRIPDECDGDCNANRIADECDLATGTSIDCNANGRPDECDVALPKYLDFKELNPILAAETFLLLTAFDATGDGAPDVAVARGDDLVLLENVKGELKDSTVLLRESRPQAAVARDFDGDGRVDLAIGTARTTGISILVQRGGGVFEPGAPLPLPWHVSSLDAADLDGDGLSDLVAVGDGPQVGIFFQRGGGGFGEGELIDAGGAVSFIRVADVDNDLHPDLVATGKDGGGFIVIRNEGRGVFSTPVIQAETMPSSFEVGDVNRDGFLDLVAVDSTQDGGMTIHYNDGKGRFPPGDFPGVGDSGVFSLALLDSNGDHYLDMAIIGDDSLSGPGLHILLHDGDPLGTGGIGKDLGRIVSASLLAADMDSNGQMDLVAALSCSECGGPSPDSVNVFLNTSPFPTSQDVDRDGIPDECQGPFFYRGDSSQDGVLDLTDAVTVLRYLFLGEEEPACLEAADVENDGQVVLADAVLILNYLFRGGPPPALPGPPGSRCGHDPDSPGSPGALGCGSYPACSAFEVRRF